MRYQYFRYRDASTVGGQLVSMEYVYVHSLGRNTVPLLTVKSHRAISQPLLSYYAAGDRPPMPLPSAQSCERPPVPIPESPTLWTSSASHCHGTKSTTLPASGCYRGAPSPSNTPKMGRAVSPQLRASYAHECMGSNQPVQQADNQRKRAESVDTYAYARVKH